MIRLILSLLFVNPLSAQTINGVLEPNDTTLPTSHFIDEHTIPGVVGQHVTVVVTSESIDPVVTLVSPSGERVENDDCPSSEDYRSCPSIFVRQAGMIQILVRSFSVGELGPYQIQVFRDNAAPSNELDSAIRAEAEAAVAAQTQSFSAANADLEERIAEVETTIGTFQRQLAARAEVERETERVRFNRTLDVLTSIVDESEELDFVTRREGITSDFRRLTDLSQNDQVRRLLTYGGDRDRQERQIPALTKLGEFIENPIVSTVLSVARLFTATKDPADRVSQLGELVCALDVATTAGIEIRTADALLEDAGETISSVLLDSKNLLSLQLGLVGYEAHIGLSSTVESYLNESISDRRDRIAQLLDSRIGEEEIIGFLSDIQSLSTQTASLAARYNDALNTYGNYLGSYTTVIETVADRPCVKDESLDVSIVTYTHRGDINQRQGPVPVVPFADRRSMLDLAERSRDLEVDFRKVYKPVQSSLINSLNTSRLLARQ